MNDEYCFWSGLVVLIVGACLLTADYALAIWLMVIGIAVMGLIMYRWSQE